jgi:hypothetical protein
MKNFERHLCLALIVAVMVAGGGVWITPLQAESDTSQPTLKDLIDKRSKGKVQAETAASMFLTIR